MALPQLSTSSRQQQHVVAVPLPAQGHLNPLMRFCKLLASQGVLVTFVNIDSVHHRIEDQLKPQVAEVAAAAKQHAGDEARPDVAAVRETDVESIRRVHIPLPGLDLANDFRISFQLFHEAFAHGLAAPLEALLHQLNRQGPPVTCLLSDFFINYLTPNVAHNLSIPWVLLFPSSASLLLLMYYVTQGERISTAKVLEALSTRAESREVFCEGLAGLPTIYNDDLPHLKHLVDETVFLWELVAKVCSPESFRRARAVAINSFEDLEAPALLALSQHLSLPVYGVGPLVEPLHKESSTSLWKEDEACILWLDQQPPLSVLYISFGSITLLSQPQIEEIIAGLLSSKQRFLWVFRPDLVEDVDYSRALVSDVLSRSHGKGYVAHWAPQVRVLSHPSVGGFLTHCGWNSTLEAIAQGVPMLSWPYFADQLLDAKYVVEEWKVGLQFKASREGGCLVERDEIERVIKALMEGEEGTVLRKNVMRLKEAGSQSLLPGGTSHNNIQSLIRSFMEPTS